jgi:hypothetical protein
MTVSWNSAKPSSVMKWRYESLKELIMPCVDFDNSEATVSGSTRSASTNGTTRSVRNKSRSWICRRVTESAGVVLAGRPLASGSVRRPFQAIAKCRHWSPALPLGVHPNSNTLYIFCTGSSLRRGLRTCSTAAFGLHKEISKKEMVRENMGAPRNESSTLDESTLWRHLSRLRHFSGWD